MMNENTQRYLTAKRATAVNASCNFILSVFKIMIGLFGNSQALVADGIHSFSDLFTDALVFFSVKIGSQRPDKEHPYGHRRVETVSTIIIALILIGVALGIGIDAIKHIHTAATSEHPTIGVIVVAIISVVVNEFLYHYTLSQGNKINSDLLRSNAWHNRSDSLVSLIVLVSVIGSLLGAHYLDAIGALIIAIIILTTAIKMIWKSTLELIDTAVEEQVAHEITEFITTIPGVVSIHELRTRYHGEQIFLDVHLQVHPEISISEGHYISEQVIFNLKRQFSQITDAIVHIDPENDEEFYFSKNLPPRDHVETLINASCKELPGFAALERITLHYLNGVLLVDFYLPLSVYTPSLACAYQGALQKIDYIGKITLYYYEGSVE